MDLARHGTSFVVSVTDPRGHDGSSQNQRRLRHSTSAAPARRLAWNAVRLDLDPGRLRLQ